jgi:putative DNA primase/helicase
MAVEFKAVAEAALLMAPTLLPQWLGGKRQGHEWVGERKANGGLGDSWAVNLNTGNWLHGAGDERGLDLISLYAALNHLDQLAALKQVAPLVGVLDGPTAPRLPPEKPPESKPERIPADAPEIPQHYKHGVASAVYAYGNAFLVARYDLPDGKQFSPFTWRNGKWHAKGYPEPRPLYGLPQLEQRPEAPVLVVEGEKCADIAAHTLKRYVAVTWSGGVPGVKKSDWSALAGRDVIIWPDADEPGKAAAAIVAEKIIGIAQRVRVVQPNGQADGWDIGDAVAEGWDSKAIATWAGEHIKLVEAPAPAAASQASPEPLLPSSEGSELATTESAPPGEYEEGRSAVVSWDSLNLDTNQGGLPHPTVANGSRIIQVHPRLAGKIWYDSFRDHIYHTLHGGIEKEWTDADDVDLTVFIQQQLKLNKFNVMMMQSAVGHAARLVQRNSLTDWLDSLEWDGEPRLETWLSDCLGVDYDEYSAAVATNWPISMVARAYRPGCQVDTMPVLEGAQGRGKSKFLEILGGQWYKSLPMAFGDKDFLQAIQGAWLIEIPDMTGFSRREHSQILATISIRSDVYRRSYGRHTETHPRIAVFAATSETDDYLSDTRGRRRYWPLRCRAVDLDALRFQREQVFAEAVTKYRAGASWYVMPAQADSEQLDRAPEDIWTDKVIGYAENLWADKLPITSSRILTDAIEMKLSQQGDSEKRRIARIMRDNGWIQKRTTHARYWKKVER